MRDLKDLLAPLADEEMPDRWDEVRRREPSKLPERRRGPRIATYAVSFAAAALVVVIVAGLEPLGGGPQPSHSPATVAPGTTPVLPSGDSVRGGRFVAPVALDDGKLLVEPAPSDVQPSTPLPAAMTTVFSDPTFQGQNDAVFGFGLVTSAVHGRDLAAPTAAPAWIGFAWGGVYFCPAITGPLKRYDLPSSGYVAVVLPSDPSEAPFAYRARTSTCGSPPRGPSVVPARSTVSIPWTLVGPVSGTTVTVRSAIPPCGTTPTYSAGGHRGVYTLSVLSTVPLETQDCTATPPQTDTFELAPTPGPGTPTYDVTALRHGPLGRVRQLNAGTRIVTTSKAPSGQSGSSVSPAVLEQYVNPMGIPITVAYPSEWFAQSVSQPVRTASGANGGTQIGLVVSDSSAAMPTPDAAAPSPGPLPADPHLPSDFVSITILSTSAQTLPDVPDTPLPLSMRDAKVAPGGANIRILEARVTGWPLTIQVQAGPRATDADLAAADAIVASIRPSDPTTAAPSTRGSQAPSLSGTTLDGGSVSPGDLTGKTVVLGVWASWCVPCGAQLEAMEQTATRFAGDPNVVVLGLNLDGDHAAAAAFARTFGATFPSLADGGPVAGGLHLSGVPTIFVINGGGDVVAAIAGAPTHPEDLSSVGELAGRVNAAVEGARTQ
jgi:thiol-disulfide isomerase/thioredoxin